MKFLTLIFGFIAIISFQYGLVIFIYSFVSFISFLFGFSILEHIYPQMKETIKCNMADGISQIKKIFIESDCTSNQSGDCHITDCPELNEKLKEIVDYFVDDILHDMNDEMPEDSKLPYLLHQSIYSMLTNLSIRCQSVDWVSFLTDALPNMLISHIGLYRKSTEKIKMNKLLSTDKTFFDYESELETKLCHEKLCYNLEKEMKYLRQLSTILLYLTMPSSDFGNKPLRYLIRECLVQYVILPLLNTFSDPDKINQLVLQLLSKKSFNGNYTNEYFLQSIEISNSCEEILAVLDKITSFENRLKSKDTGGTQDRLIRSQLSSLSHLRQVCARKIKKIKSGVTDEPNFLFSMLNPESLPDLSLNQILRRDVAVASFLDFLSTIGLEHYLRLHLSLAAYQLSASSSTNKDAEDDLSLFAMKIYEDLIKCAQTDNRLDKSAINSCLTKIKKGFLKPDLFEKVQLQILKLLQEDRCFGAFKSSSYYLQLLSEMDLLNENMEPIDSMRSTTSSLYSSDDSEPTFGWFAAKILSSDESKNNDINYTINVYCKYPDSIPETWLTRRNYSQFVSFHSYLMQRFPGIPDLRFPQIMFSKTKLNNLDTKVKELNEYIHTILLSNLMENSDEYRKVATQFFNPFDWSKPQGSFSSGILHAVTSVGNGLLSVPSYIFNTMTKDLSMSSSLDTIVRPLSIYDFNSRQSSGCVYDKNDLFQDGSGNIPVNILFRLIEEIFDLKQKNQIVQRGILSILHRIVATLFGSKVNKMIVDQAINLTSTEQLAIFADYFIDFKWPERNGKLKKQKVGERDSATKMRTRVLCRTKMLGSFSSELNQYLGNQSTRLGVQRVFNMLQEKRLNRRFLHISMESILARVFQQNHISMFFHDHLCPALQGRRCQKSCANFLKLTALQQSLDIDSTVSSKNLIQRSKTLPY